MHCPFFSENPERNCTLEIVLCVWLLFTFGSSMRILDWMIFIQIATLAIVVYILYYIIHKDTDTDNESIAESLEEVKEMVESPEPSPKEETTTEFSDILNRNNAT